MAEDPVVNLLRQHFKKVNECLRDKKNFDILTRFSFRSTCDKAIDDTDFYTDDEYVNPEFEMSQRRPGKSFPEVPRQILDTSIEEIESEEFQAETDFDGSSIGRRSVSEATSSVYNTTFEDADQREENEVQYPVIPYRKPSRKSLLERPQTPMLEMYDSEEESEYYEYSDPTPRKMEGSQKFILYPEQLQAGDLNFAGKNEELSHETTVERPEMLGILPRKEDTKEKCRIPTPEENERAFNEELEMYKRDIKLEQTIRSDKNFHDRSLEIHPPTSSCSQCTKSIRGLDERSRIFEIDSSSGLDANEKVPEYLKNYFEEAKTNVCRKSSECHRESSEKCNFGSPYVESSVDNDLLELVYEKIFSNTSSKHEGLNSPAFEKANIADNNYFTMNHLEIQKEMMKRIEDMYKPGDGKYSN
ncbi:uncharacterized protein LOC123307657 [Coccinella septempunctata]|uniref:uncharacterized protein LOC123307657 n=1 Tax=Coccinella septempunctata TaxID=41139 RepID=UPI001D05DEE6|nr:uncharacterized protein LOC123307657 [Coccinella septempunctata]